ncbi:hypothetical protein KDK82_2327 [Delftia sp. K82]|uniref:hypothetical protein n=1 Tax=Delftia sp. K82 TaxID=1472718 RepID=UPI000B48A4DE|nr:hypothetical protein [Delftia sp. K82]OWG18847.1 hypothetical protein KDK82_2327 [Delftia sp. K82]
MAEARKPKTSAQALLGTAPRTLNGSAWLEQHEALTHHLLHMMARALAKPAGRATDGALQPIAQAYTALRAHAKQVVGDAAPVVLAADGRHAIPFEKLSEARAKVAVLQAELQAAHIARAQARDLLALVQSCMAQGTAPSAELAARIRQALGQTTSTEPHPGEGQEAVQDLVRGLASHEFNAGRQAMHTDILALLSRRLGEMAAASKRYPQTAGTLNQAAGVLKVARKQIQEIHP